MKVVWRNAKEGKVTLATTNIKAGQSFFQERPELVWSEKGNHDDNDNGSINFLTAFSKMPVEKRDSFLRSYFAPGETHWEIIPKAKFISQSGKRLKQQLFADDDTLDESDIIRALLVRSFNGKKLDSNREAMYQVCSKLNHSCLPNCRFSFDDKAVCTLTAISHIKAGDDLCFSYMGPSVMIRGTQARRTHLALNYLFDCNCKRCLSEDTCRTTLCPTCNTHTAWPEGKPAGETVGFSCSSCGEVVQVADSWREWEVRLANMVVSAADKCTPLLSLEDVEEAVGHLQQQQQHITELQQQAREKLGPLHWCTALSNRTLAEVLLCVRRRKPAEVGTQTLRQAIKEYIEFLDHAIAPQMPFAGASMKKQWQDTLQQL